MRLLTQEGEADADTDRRTGGWKGGSRLEEADTAEPWPTTVSMGAVARSCGGPGTAMCWPPKHTEMPRSHKATPPPCMTRDYH